MRPALANPPPAWTSESVFRIARRQKQTPRRFHAGIVAVMGEAAARHRNASKKYIAPSGVRTYSTLVKARIDPQQAQERQ